MGQNQGQLKGSQVLRIGTWTLKSHRKTTGFVGALGRWKVQIACVQRIKWKDGSTNESGASNKIFYDGKCIKINAVRVLTKQLI